MPGRNAVAVAELTMGLILALDRRIADNVADARQGRWAQATYSKANGLLGSTLGIVGLGSIGLAVAERAAGFGRILVNTSRGDVVDEAALLAALDAGHIRAGLDVFADEPGSGTAEWDSPLARHPRVVATHHIGASTQQAHSIGPDSTGTGPA